MGINADVKESVTLDIVIVNWNSGEQLYHCLRSIDNVDKDDFTLRKVVVVDNASKDDSLKDAKQTQLPIHTIMNESNRGFAAACNQGARSCDSDYILFLNPDACLYMDSLCKPLFFLVDQENLHIGILGIQLINEEGKISRSCSRLPTPGLLFNRIVGLNLLLPKLFKSTNMIEWDHLNSQEVEQVMGSFFLLRRKVYEALCGFDEQFFVYYEEVDFSARAYKAGWRSYYCADVSAYHKGGGTSEQVRDIRLFYSLRSRIYYIFKHFNILLAFLLVLATLTVEFFARVIGALVRFKLGDIKETFRAYLLLWKATPVIIKSCISKNA